jgi:aryl-alcohol dehydrogenase-like predicted oxidoreductase
MEAHAHAVLDAAIEAGVGYVDAARSYGAAEDFLGNWLARRGLRAGELTVGSKWGYTYTAGWTVDAEVREGKDHSLGALMRQFPESWALLGAHLAVYQVHSATPDSGILGDDAVLDALARLRDERGLVVGLTTSGPGQGEVIERAIAVERGGAPVFGVIQATWNVLEPSAGPALARARDAGLGVIVKEALANGRLTDRNTDLHPEVRARLLSAVPGARSIDQAALAIAMAQPFADVVLSGAATVAQVRSNAAALTVADHAEPAGARRLAEEPAAYWGRRGGLPWN